MQVAAGEINGVVFNSTFFAEYEMELAGSEAQNSIDSAFRDSTLIQAESVATTSYTQLTQEVKLFCNRSEVKLLEQSLGAAIMNSAAECAAHQHGVIDTPNAADKFGTLADQFVNDNPAIGGEHGHDHEDQKHDEQACKNCQSGKPCAKR